MTANPAILEAYSSLDGVFGYVVPIFLATICILFVLWIKGMYDLGEK